MLHACMCLIVVMLEDLTVLVNDTWCVLPTTWLLSKKLMMSVLGVGRGTLPSLVIHLCSAV